MAAAELVPGADALPRQRQVLQRLRNEVVRGDQWRWLELGCSLAAGRGDQYSDIDAGIGYAAPLEPAQLDQEGSALVAAAGEVVDQLVHAVPGWSPQVRRFAVEYASGVQLDLVLMPAQERPGLPPGGLALCDKDGQLATAWRPPAADPPSAAQAREWTMLGWWAISDVAKYLRRASWYEAAERVGEARQQALRLFAAARRVPYPVFGLVSLLDTEPAELPRGLDRTYCEPTGPEPVAAAALATADLLAAAAADAAVVLQADLDTAWEATARRRLVPKRARTGTRGARSKSQWGQKRDVVMVRFGLRRAMNEIG